MARLTFRMGDAFPANEPIALWMMNLSIALGDLRIVAKYATRDGQPDYERFYFIRLFSAHLREISKLLVLDYREREDVRDFVASLPQGAQVARDEVDRMLHAMSPLRPDVMLWKDIKRLRDDTFHYAREAASQERLRLAIVAVEDTEGAYDLDTEDGRLRADYADLVGINRMHPFEQDESLPVTRDLHERILALTASS